MRTLLFSAALLAASSLLGPPGQSADNGRGDRDRLTIAVFGDWPYSQVLFDNSALLLNSINQDPDVSLVMHVGDIHSGSMACTSAGILPPIPASNPGWNQAVYYRFQQFHPPVVYTPGDNEWTDCHKAKEFSSGAPPKELASVRTLFFARPGHTLGLEDRPVLSQAQFYNQQFPADAQFVENVMWEDSKVVFVTLNVPGSNNDTLPWTGSFADPTAQAAEVAQRTAADIRWLDAAFDVAAHDNAKAVVIGLQADMWDPAALGGDGLDGYTSFVQHLADRVVQFGGPVLLLNGDSHVFGADQPLLDPTTATGRIHKTQAVPNLTRITVQGSTTAPAEWLKLSIDTHKPNPFSWTNIAYCNNPATSCQ
jgi:hypothetical protein